MTTQPSRSSWGTLIRMARPRATRANALAALLAIGLGFAIATQVQQTSQSGLEQLREDELVRILDDVSQEQGRLGTDTRALEVTRDRLLSGADSGSAALKSAQDRLDTLGILTGTVPATGPGVVITITDPSHKVTSALLLDALQELRDAGAEAVQIGDVRVVANTWFADVDGAVQVSGQQLSSPYVIRAIGDSATMASAMDIPGGVTDSVRGQNAQSTVEQEKSLSITALHSLPEPRYARPVPAPSK
ncbi:DUF881 domain-containing protein [Nostocoides sp. HKS02]|uniref:DUF881 domain-containing protein n=1 Tax=Nostocoides sp. HKS02 TaxID=1813880 RepID=UPI0012B4FC57|nr:DUF881 domain-containing protein [Tetrasphaera sp. HKS02]QGN57340.1 DUF881 domain-containing protein [Tetrasphaera sp. HKS02]